VKLNRKAKIILASVTEMSSFTFKPFVHTGVGVPVTVEAPPLPVRPSPSPCCSKTFQKLKENYLLNKLTLALLHIICATQCIVLIVLAYCRFTLFITSLIRLIRTVMWTWNLFILLLLLHISYAQPYEHVDN
jgi:hypothetical protein